MSEWEVTEDTDSTEKTVKCPDCGRESTVNAELAVIHDRVECQHCGNEKKLNAPGAWIAILVLVAAYLYLHLIHRPKQALKKLLG